MLPRTLSLVVVAGPACCSVVPAPPRAATGAPWWEQGAFSVAAPAPAGFDLATAAEATGARLEQLAAIDTRNPPGNERAAAEWLAAAR